LCLDDNRPSKTTTVECTRRHALYTLNSSLIKSKHKALVFVIGTTNRREGFQTFHTLVVMFSTMTTIGATIIYRTTFCRSFSFNIFSLISCVVFHIHSTLFVCISCKWLVINTLRLMFICIKYTYYNIF